MQEQEGIPHLPDVHLGLQPCSAFPPFPGASDTATVTEGTLAACAAASSNADSSGAGTLYQD